MKKCIENLTIVAITSVKRYETIRAMLHSMKGLRFEKATFLSDKRPWYLPRRITYIQIPKLNSVEEYSRFCLYELYKYISTDYAMIVQYDGFVKHPKSGRIHSWTTIILEHHGNLKTYENSPQMNPMWLAMGDFRLDQND